MISYRLISASDPEYAIERELRDRVLRRPLGLTLSERDLEGEDVQAHIIAQDGSGPVIGCVLVSFAGGVAKARQLAVDEKWRGKGIGRELMQRAEDAARERKFDRLSLHGRVASVRFFERLGYEAVSEVFTEVTVPHIRLEKVLERKRP